MSPRLRPGVVVVRRDDAHLQVGLEPPRRVVLPDVPEVRRLLEDLRGDPRPPVQPDALAPRAAQALARLEAAGVLAAPQALSADLLGIAITGPRGLVDVATAALRGSGLRVGSRGGVRLLLGQGVLRREVADELVRDGVPHLAAVVTPWGWEVGPFVVPGATACLRCVDAAQRDHDPRYGVVLDQVIRAAAPVPVAAPLSDVALGWIARDLLAHARGERPTTWSTTVQLSDAPTESPDGDLVGQRRWLRHPHCGCAWDALTG